MPSTAIEQAATPSRQFMVQQAVLNAIEYCQPFYSKAWCASWCRDYVPQPFLAAIQHQYRILAARYGQVAA